MLEIIVDTILLALIFSSGLFALLKPQIYHRFSIRLRRNSYQENLPYLGKLYKRNTSMMKNNEEMYLFFYRLIGIGFILFGCYLTGDIIASHHFFK